MQTVKSPLATLAGIALLFSLIVIPRTSAVPAGADIYVFVGNESGTRQPIKSNGDGTFTVGTAFTYGDNNRGGAIEDYDEDGDLDFIGCSNALNRCHLFVHGPAGTFTQSTDLEPSGIGLGGVESGMAADDFDQDGNMDVLLGGNSNLAAIYFGDGTGGFPTFIDGLLPVIPGASAYREKDTGDLDGNGYPDVVIGVIPSGEVYSYLNTAGTFTGPFRLFDTTGTSNAVFALTVADFDGDGFLDVIAGGASDGEVALFKGDGTGNSSTSFTHVGPVYDFDTQSAVDSYDFDNDGDQDLVAVKRSTGEIFYFAGNGDGTFQPPALLGSVPTLAFGIAAPPQPPILPKIQGHVLKDLNGNGLNDDGAIGIELVALSLTGTDYLGRSVSQTAVSAADGSFLFRAPISDAAGYSLQVTTPVSGLPTTTESRTVSVPRAHSVISEDFLYLPFSTVQGIVFDDRNGNGLNDDGAGGWTATTLTLTGADYRGTAVSLSATTSDTTGAFAFGGLLPSNAAGYALAVTAPPPGSSATTPASVTVPLLTGDAVETRNFGYVGDSVIGGTFFSDINGNGINDDDPALWEAFDPDQLYSLGLSGTDFQGGSVDRTTTGAADGAYSLPALKLSDAAGYTLQVTSAPPAELNHPTTPTTRTIFIAQGSSAITEDFGFQLICTDADSDGFRTEGGLCGPVDCNDGSAAAHPGAAETCNGIDDNCDGIVDESFPDEDGDGVTTCGGDCNDTNPAIRPGATETCNLLDDNCDGTTDEGFDADGDGVTSCGGDCNDLNAAIKPGAAEVCNLTDDNCDSMIDEGFDADGDGYTTCGGDCNDTVVVGQEGFLTINITGVSSSGPGANMTDAVFLGDNALPFGAGSVTIPLSLNSAAITDPASSSPDVAGLHVLRGNDSVKGPFIRLTAYGHNESKTREAVSGNFTLLGAHVSGVQNGPDGPYEGQGNGTCEEGKPSKDEYTIPANGATGTFCSTTNVHRDTVTIFYALESALACDEIVNPALQCSDPSFSACGACIHPGAPDSFIDGVDSDCDETAECTEKKDYAPGTQCEGAATVTNDAALDAYIANFGLTDGKFRHLKIDYDVARGSLFIHSPCRITLKEGHSITVDTALCLDGRKGVRTEGTNVLSSPRLALLSEQRGVRLGARSRVTSAIELVLKAFRRVRIGVDSVLMGGTIRLKSQESEHAVTSVGARAVITAAQLSLTAERKAKLGPHTAVTVTGNFHMDAPRCSIANSATITAGSKSGSCFTVPASPLKESDREEEEEMRKDDRDSGEEEE